MSEKCKIIQPNSEIDRLLYEKYTNEFRKGYVEIGEEKICMPMTYKDIADEIENFEVRDSDIFITSHPKTGTTWSQEMIWMIVNKLDYEGAKKNLVERFPFLEFSCIFDYNDILKKYPDFQPSELVTESVNLAKNYKPVPRLIKTHLPWSLLPKALREGKTKAKIIYVARNPKDTCVSFYHHGRIIEGFKGDFDDFCKLFMAGRLNYGPFWTNVLGFWGKRYDENILFIKYEDMKRDLPSVIRQVSDFLIRYQYSDKQIEELTNHLSFENMRTNEHVNYEDSSKINERFIPNPEEGGRFMRSGIVGTYKKEMTKELEEIFNKWSEEKLNGANITF